MLWLKALHLIFVVCWFAGVFYLPRLFVNLAASQNSAVNETLLAMAGRLYRFMTLLAALALLFGVVILVDQWQVYRHATWMYAKLGLVALLIGYHLACGQMLARFQAGDNHRSHVFYRWFNEVPVLILCAVVVLVIVRPF